MLNSTQNDSFAPSHSICLSRRQLIVLSEAIDQPYWNGDQALQVSTEIARILGFFVCALPNASQVAGYFGASHLITERLGAMQDGFDQVLSQRTNSGIWIGATPNCDRYRAIYNASLAQNIQLLNTPDQYAQVQSKDRHMESNWRQILPYSGSVSQNGKDFHQEISLRYSHSFANPAALPRIFRIFLYHQTVLTYGYRWNIDDPLKWLKVEDEEAIFAVAQATAQSVSAPFVAIDVGQLENQQWVGLAIYDAQFALLKHIPLLQLWYELEKFFQSSDD